MAEIDYAFLADFAKVEPTGTLTAVGASWTHVNAAQIPTGHRLAVAGRIRSRDVDGDVALRISVTGPGKTFEIVTEGLLTAANAMVYGDGWVGLLFALDLQVPLPSEGLYWVEVSLPGSDESRRLGFEVRRAPVEA